jgi:hypothetical protein
VTDDPQEPGPQPIVPPQHLDALPPDQLVAALLRLSMEISVLRDRLASQEALLEQNGLIQRQAIETYTPSTEEQGERNAARTQLIERLLHDLS